METSKGNGSSCAVKYCNNKSRTTVGISYFTMPKNIERRSKWIEQCIPQYIDKNAFVQNLRVCSEHFEDKMFLNVHKKNRLTDFAVPTLFNDEILAKRAAESDLTKSDKIRDLSMPMTCSSPIASTSTSLSLIGTSDLSSQTPDHLYFRTPRKLRLRTELKEAKEKIRNLKKNVQTLKVLGSEDIFIQGTDEVPKSTVHNQNDDVDKINLTSTPGDLKNTQSCTPLDSTKLLKSTQIHKKLTTNLRKKNHCQASASETFTVLAAKEQELVELQMSCLKEEHEENMKFLKKKHALELQSLELDISLKKQKLNEH